MWYYLFPFLHEQNILLRGLFAGLTAFIVGIITGPYFLSLFKKLQLLEDTQRVASEALRRDAESKQHTPTMGGLMMLFVWLFSVLLWSEFWQPYVFFGIAVTVGFAAVGFADDWIKLTTPRKGLNAKNKTFMMLIVAIGGAIACWHMAQNDPKQTALSFLFYQEWQLNLASSYGIWFIAFATVVILGSSDAVNLTDGMDGLATGCTLITSLALATVAYIVSQEVISQQLGVVYVKGANELMICCLALAGATLSFLWYNSNPASVFMGDCGALMLGGLLGYVAVALRQEFFLFVSGGIFVIEALSVILQVSYFKRTKKRIFRCAPIHYHFRLGGMSETKIVVRFWTIQLLLAIIAIAIFICNKIV